ncbi:carbohydrate-binding domain-containing protein, partial [Ruminococcaceae bacterium OttesenSCG-928-I18]|nr:carbohydrate-binding domain-containing protein [Ruminococcaceae bacterium OttesenSCG-928-I18]
MKPLSKPSLWLCFLVAACLLLYGCTAPPSDNSDSTSAATPAATPSFTDYASAQVKEEDFDTEWAEPSSTIIECNGTEITIQGGGAQAENGGVTITEEGTYVLSGTLEDGQVFINAPDTALVRLILNGVTLHCSASAPLYCQQADKLVVTLAEGTTNTLTDGESYTFPDAATDEPSAALFSTADLTLNGTGGLDITSLYNNGIGTKDDLVLVSGKLNVEAANHALRGRDSVTVLEASLTLTAGNDGIQANND